MEFGCGVEEDGTSSLHLLRAFWGVCEGYGEIDSGFWGWSTFLTHFLMLVVGMLSLEILV